MDRIGQVVEIKCAKCKLYTKHTIQGAYDTSWYDETEGYGEECQHNLLSCNGCDEVAYQRKAFISGEPGGEEVFPARK